MVHVAPEVHLVEDIVKPIDICIAKPAVPRDYGGYTLVGIAAIFRKAGYSGCGGHYVFPETLKGEVAVIMNIDKAGRHDKPSGIDTLCTFAQVAADGSYPVIPNPDVGNERICQSTVIDRPVPNNGIVPAPFRAVRDKGAGKTRGARDRCTFQKITSGGHRISSVSRKGLPSNTSLAPFARQRMRRANVRMSRDCKAPVPSEGYVALSFNHG